MVKFEFHYFDKTFVLPASEIEQIIHFDDYFKVITKDGKERRALDMCYVYEDEKVPAV